MFTTSRPNWSTTLISICQRGAAACHVSARSRGCPCMLCAAQLHTFATTYPSSAHCRTALVPLVLLVLLVIIIPPFPPARPSNQQRAAPGQRGSGRPRRRQSQSSPRPAARAGSRSPRASRSGPC
eukprot:1444602-Rhodomonas_salina.1